MTIAVHAGSFEPVTAGHQKLARGEDVSDFCPPAVAAKLRLRLCPSSLRSP